MFFCPLGCLDCVDDNEIQSHQLMYQAHFCAQLPNVKKQVAWQRLVETVRLNAQSVKSRYLKLKFKETFLKSDGSSISVEMCQNCYFNVMVRDVFGLSRTTFHRMKAEAKKDLGYGTHILDTPKDFGSRKTPVMGSRHKNIHEARKYYAEHKITFESEFDLMLTCIAANDGSIEALTWMDDFFASTGDKAPVGDNRVELNGLYSYQVIYELFKNEVTNNSTEMNDVITYSTFRRIWRNCFPNVRIKKYLSVNGKCEICALIFDREEHFRTKEDVDYLRFLKAIHRHSVMKCRHHYYANKRLARDYPSIYMSLILDGMQQAHCNLPHRANNKVYDKEVIQHIQGVRHHGFWDSFYRTFPHISGGGNLAVDVLLREIKGRMDHCIENDLPFPRILFLQIDGGSENACVTFYAMCQVLVKLGVFDHIELNRLPVGHTHEDIDALFGKIWAYVRHSTIKTPQEWAEHVKSSFL